MLPGPAPRLLLPEPKIAPAATSPSDDKTTLGAARRLASDVVDGIASAPAALDKAFDGADAHEGEAVSAKPDLQARAPGTIPITANILNRHLPKVMLIDLRHMGDLILPDALEKMSRLMGMGVNIILISDMPQEGPRSVDEMMNRGISMAFLSPKSILHRQLLSLSGDGNELHRYEAGGRKLIEPKTFSKDMLTAFNTAMENTRLGYMTKMEGGNYTARPKRLRTAQELADAMVDELDKAGIPREVYALSFVEEGTEMQVQLRPTTLARAIPHLVEALNRHGVKVQLSDLLVISKSKDVLDATPGALQPAQEAPEAYGEQLLRACLAAMLAGR